MTVQSKMTIDLKKLEAIRSQLGKKYYAKVGILDNSSHNEIKRYYTTKTLKKNKTFAIEGASNLTNLQLGIIHMFGSQTNNIPPRDFLMMPLTEKKKDLINFLGSPAVKKRIEAGNIKGVFGLLGLKAEEIVQNAFQSSGFGKWPALKPATIKAKGSSKPLIDTGQLRRSIASEVVKR